MGGKMKSIATQKAQHILPEDWRSFHFGEFQKYVDPIHLWNLEAAFVFMSNKKIDYDLSQIYIDERSILANFKKIFGIKNASLAWRFYLWLADGTK